MKKILPLFWFSAGVLTDLLSAVLLTLLCYLHPFFINKVIPVMLLIPLILGWKVYKQNKPFAQGLFAGLIPVIIFIFHSFSIVHVIQ